MYGYLSYLPANQNALILYHNETDQLVNRPLEIQLLHQTKHILAIAIILSTLLPGTTHAGWKDRLRQWQETLQSEEPSSVDSTPSLSPEEIIRGLKEALEVAAQRAVATLGRNDGFLTHPQLRIPMPESLSKIEELLRKLNQDQLADEFIATMNHAAEQAVSEGAEVFSAAIREMMLQDATDILQGPDDAATRYFRRRTETPLIQRMQPIVIEATEATGVTRAYKRILDNAGFLARHMKPEETDLDAYITQRALDGLFQELALEEARIRKDPVARTTELLRKVFSK